ncbi:hypothetical protein [Gorillibacterium massiliense]|uniref:hypothetical protein n=1 Tax=Gorillibacterium massiliense TaxID=1280390 RepID=UPI0004B12913|nr:hypothetical protein [Gorillibacterium massiliense]
MLALIFSAFVLLEWKRLKKQPARMKWKWGGIWAFFTLWNLMAVFVPWWPNPNGIIVKLFGWVD